MRTASWVRKNQVPGFYLLDPPLFELVSFERLHFAFDPPAAGGRAAPPTCGATQGADQSPGAAACTGLGILLEILAIYILLCNLINIL